LTRVQQTYTLSVGQRTRSGPADAGSLALATLAPKGNTVTRDEILSKLAAGELKVEEASKLLAEFDGPKRGALYCKVSEKGALSVYGLQRMPVTLYMEQWERLLEFSDHIKQFIKENAGSLKKKDTPVKS
jgi:hypothetical protein